MAVPFILKYLAISRMPGFDRGMKAYRDFSAQINLIAGPNASGKSSTARMIRQIIWRDNTEGIRAEGSAEIDGAKWNIHINSHSVLVQKEGIDAEMKGLPAKESGGRYELALHKLVLERDEDIAQEIARLASGGYNLGKAEEQLGYSLRTPDRRLTEYTVLNDAREKRKSIEQNQQELRDDEQRLLLLGQQLEDSKKASQMLQLYEKVIAFKQSQQQEKRAKNAMEQFPEVLQRATGRELADAEATEAEIVKLEQQVAIETAGIRKEEERLGQLQIPPGGISGVMLREMEERVLKIAELEREIASTGTELAKSLEAERNAANEISTDIDPDQWKGISLEGIGNLEEFLQKSQQKISEKQYLISCIKVLDEQVAGEQVAGEQVAGEQVAGGQVAGGQVAGGQVAGEQVAGGQVAGGQVADGHPDPEKIKSGISILNAWLNSGNGYRDSRTGQAKKQQPDGQTESNSTRSASHNISLSRLNWHLPALAAAGAATAAAVYWLGGAGFVGLIIIGVLTLLYYLRTGRTADIAERELRRKDFEKTGLPQPDQWSESSVLARLHQLQESLQSALWQAKLRLEKEQYVKSLKALQPALDEIMQIAGRLREKLKGLPALPEDDPKNYTGLYWYVVQVQKWQQHRENSETLRAALAKFNKDLSRELDMLNRLFEKAGAVRIYTEGTGTGGSATEKPGDEGSLAEGTATGGSVAEKPGDESNGTDGSQADGSQADGTQADGTQADDTQADGTLAGEAKDRITARAIFEGIKEQELAGRSASEQLKIHRERLKGLEQDIEKKQRELAGIYTSLELKSGDRKALGMLMDRIGDYRNAADEWRSAVQRLEDRRSELREHSLYEAFAENIATMTIDEAEAERMQHKAEAEAWENRSNEIAAINARIDGVRSGNSLEEALLKEESALEALREAFEKNLAAATGKLLTDQLRADSYGNNPSDVYVRANELFSRITSGRYGLRIDERGDGGFRAYDNTLSRGQELEELSTGTRIQLLLSVRLAYIEQQEEGLKLPVLADELLANCDDTRAAAIIEALIAISREGRQVFYFTAQADEVAKWKYYLEKEKVEHRVFELNGGAAAASGVDSDAATETYTGSKPPAWDSKRKPVKFFREVPEPGNLSHEAYGEIIAVEPFDPLTQEAEQIHLWYILEDPPVLFECLRRNISSWGQLRSFAENGGSLPGFTDENSGRLKSHIQLLQAFITHYRQGRSRPVDIVVLERSGAVSPKFIDAVNTLLESLENDPLSLVKALKNREVPGFRENKINELEEYLTAEGYISLQEKLETDEIIHRLHTTFPEMETDSSAVERVINRIL